MFTLTLLAQGPCSLPSPPPCYSDTPPCGGGPPPPPGFPIDTYIMIAFIAALIFGVYILRKQQNKLSA